MVIWLIVLLASSMLIVWAIRDGIKNPAEPPKVAHSQEKNNDFDKRVDRIFKIVAIVLMLTFAIGLGITKVAVKKDLERMTKELMEVYHK